MRRFFFLQLHHILAVRRFGAASWRPGLVQWGRGGIKKVSAVSCRRVRYGCLHVEIMMRMRTGWLWAECDFNSWVRVNV